MQNLPGTFRYTLRQVRQSPVFETAAKPLRSEYVTGNYFSTFGVRAFAGRIFTPDDDKASAPPVAVISHQARQGTYGANPSILGSSFVIEGHPFTVIGIAPPGF